MKRWLSLSVLVWLPVGLAAGADLPPPPPQAAWPGQQLDASAQTSAKMLGPQIIRVGEIVTVVGVNRRPVPVYKGIKVVGYLYPQAEPRKVEQLRLIGSTTWARLDSMEPDTWVQVSALQLVAEVHLGMTQAQVANRIGKPSKVNRTVDGEEWVYEAYQVLVDRQFIEGRERQGALVPVINPNDPSRTVLWPTYYETVKRYVVDNPQLEKVLDKRYIFKADRLVEIRDIK